MIRKKDLLIIALVLAVAAAAYGAMLIARSGQTAGGTVDIYAGGTLYASAPLDTPQEVRVEQENGDVNIVTIEDGGFRMAFSSCKNQLCLHQGTVTADNWTGRALGRTIVCLPNRVVVELALDDGHPSWQEEVSDI